MRLAGLVERPNRRSLGMRQKKKVISILSPDEHEQIPWGWTTLPEGSAVRKDAVKGAIILTMVFGTVGAVTCKRYDVHAVFHTRSPHQN